MYRIRTEEEEKKAQASILGKYEVILRIYWS